MAQSIESPLADIGPICSLGVSKDRLTDTDNGMEICVIIYLWTIIHQSERRGCEYSLFTAAILLLYTGSNDLSMGIVLGVGGWLAFG